MDCSGVNASDGLKPAMRSRLPGERAERQGNDDVPESVGLYAHLLAEVFICHQIEKVRSQFVTLKLRLRRREQADISPIRLIDVAGGPSDQAVRRFLQRAERLCGRAEVDNHVIDRSFRNDACSTGPNVCG